MSQELAARIARIEDRIAITELAVSYCLAIDDGNYDGLVPMYAEQATMGDIVGVQQVVDLLRSIRSSYGRTIHVPEAHTISFADDDHASGVVLSHAELDIAGRTIHTYIRYYDTYVREGGSWRFADRTLKFAYAVPVEELAESLPGPDTVRWPGTPPAPADQF